MFVQMKDPTLFPWETNYEKAKIHKRNFLKSSSREQRGQFQPNLAQCTLAGMGFTFVQMKGPAYFQVEIITK